MKLLIGVAVGYVLGTKAGRERYESIVRLARRAATSAPARSVTARYHS
jgi:hypothetical protein